MLFYTQLLTVPKYLYIINSLTPIAKKSHSLISLSCTNFPNDWSVTWLSNIIDIIPQSKEILWIVVSSIIEKKYLFLR